MTTSVVMALAFALVAVLVATVSGWLAAFATFEAVSRLRLSATTRAAWLAHIRLLPLSASGILVLVQQIAFWRFEAGGRETTGPLLWLLAALGFVLLCDAGCSAIKSWRETRAVANAWRRSAEALTVPYWIGPAWAIRRRFPVVAVVGVFRPQLFIAAQVASTCTRDELAAIAAHESAHVVARDNLIRMLFRATPGVTVFAAVAAKLETAWLAAAEDAADASAREASCAIDLAAALTKVARLAANVQHEALPTSALIRDSDLRSRVHRLLDDAPAPSHRSVSCSPVVLLFGGVVAVLATGWLQRLHELFELLVRRY